MLTIHYVVKIHVKTVEDRKENSVIFPKFIYLVRASSLNAKVELDRQHLAVSCSFSFGCLHGFKHAWSLRIPLSAWVLSLASI